MNDDTGRITVYDLIHRFRGFFTAREPTRSVLLTTELRCQFVE